MMQAVPLMVAQILQLLYNVVDRIYIGHLPGEDGLALTGVGLVFPIVSIISGFTNLYGMGGAPLCSIDRGAGKIDEAERIMGNSAVLLFYTSLIVTAAVYVLKRPLLYMLGASDATYPYADSYLSIYLIGNGICHAGDRDEQLYYFTGVPENGDVYDASRRRYQSDPRSNPDFWI